MSRREMKETYSFAQIHRHHRIEPILVNHEQLSSQHGIHPEMNEQHSIKPTLPLKSLTSVAFDSVHLINGIVYRW